MTRMITFVFAFLLSASTLAGTLAVLPCIS